MRWALIVTGVLAALYAGFWFLGRQDRVAAVVAVTSGLEQAGIAVRAEDVATRGFPSRFDTRVEGLVLEGPGWTWEVPELEVAALSYRPGSLIATFPERQVLSLGGSEVVLTSERLRASVLVDRAGRVLAVTVEGTGLATGAAAADRLLVALRDRDESGDAGTYDVYLELAGAEIADRPVETARIDGVLTLAEPLTISTIASQGVLDLRLRSARARVDGREVIAEGSLAEGIAVAGIDPAVLRRLVPGLESVLR